jgi:hypothetical protein
MTERSSKRKAKRPADRKLVDTALSFRNGIIGQASSRRMCFAVCAPLLPLLAFYDKGFRGTLAESDVLNGDIIWSHVFIVLEDGRVLDPTADQFNDLFAEQMPKVYLGPPTKHLHRDAHPPRFGAAA